MWNTLCRIAHDILYTVHDQFCQLGRCWLGVRTGRGVGALGALSCSTGAVPCSTIGIMGCKLLGDSDRLGNMGCALKDSLTGAADGKGDVGNGGGTSAALLSKSFRECTLETPELRVV